MYLACDCQVPRLDVKRLTGIAVGAIREEGEIRASCTRAVGRHGGCADAHACYAKDAGEKAASVLLDLYLNGFSTDIWLDAHVYVRVYVVVPVSLRVLEALRGRGGVGID